MIEVNGQVTLQVAETRFAIKCDYAPFMEWLREACGEFLVAGEPHAKLKLSFDTNNESGSAINNAFSFTRHYGNGELNMQVMCAEHYDPEKLFRLVLNAGLLSSVNSKEPPDVWLHSAGVVYRGEAYVFTGPSGAGKSSICDVLENLPGFTILHDEIVALSRTPVGFRAWSSPLKGERPARHRQSAPLRAVFFLSHAEVNRAVRINARKIPHLLSEQLVRLLATVNNGTASINRGTFGLLLDLAEQIQYYELHFRPDFSFWECIEQLLIGEPTRKG